MVTIAALLNRYGLVMSLPSIVFNDDRGFNVFLRYDPCFGVLVCLDNNEMQ